MGCGVNKMIGTSQISRNFGYRFAFAPCEYRERRAENAPSSFFHEEIFLAHFPAFCRLNRRTIVKNEMKIAKSYAKCYECREIIVPLHS